MYMKRREEDEEMLFHSLTQLRDVQLNVRKHVSTTLLFIHMQCYRYRVVGITGYCKAAGQVRNAAFLNWSKVELLDRERGIQ